MSQFFGSPVGVGFSVNNVPEHSAGPWGVNALSFRDLN